MSVCLIHNFVLFASSVFKTFFFFKFWNLIVEKRLVFNTIVIVCMVKWFNLFSCEFGGTVINKVSKDIFELRIFYLTLMFLCLLYRSSHFCCINFSFILFINTIILIVLAFLFSFISDILRNMHRNKENLLPWWFSQGDQSKALNMYQMWGLDVRKESFNICSLHQTHMRRLWMVKTVSWPLNHYCFRPYTSNHTISYRLYTFQL